MTHRITVLASVAAAAMLLAFCLSAYSFATSHDRTCDSRKTIANLFRDLIVISGQTGGPVSAAQERARELFVQRAFARINEIRC